VTAGHVHDIVGDQLSPQVEAADEALVVAHQEEVDGVAVALDDGVGGQGGGQAHQLHVTGREAASAGQGLALFEEGGEGPGNAHGQVLGGGERFGAGQYFVGGAIGEDGVDLGSFDIAGTLAFDWEGMAAGPGSDPGTSMLYLGDIGDNFSIRDGRITVHRVPEPDPTTLTGPIEGAVALEYRYPDGVYNAEALFVWDGAIYIITKDKEEARVYRGDATGDGSDVETLELVTVLSLGAEVSGADISWDGSTIAFRGYRTVWIWHRTSDRSIADTLAGEPCTAPSPDEVQGESIAFLPDGSYATVSEGEHPDVFIVGRDG
jgi:hypothetical protein